MGHRNRGVDGATRGRWAPCEGAGSFVRPRSAGVHRRVTMGAGAHACVRALITAACEERKIFSSQFSQRGVTMAKLAVGKSLQGMGLWGGYGVTVTGGYGVASRRNQASFPVDPRERHSHTGKGSLTCGRRAVTGVAR